MLNEMCIAPRLTTSQSEAPNDSDTLRLAGNNQNAAKWAKLQFRMFRFEVWQGGDNR